MSPTGIEVTAPIPALCTPHACGGDHRSTLLTAPMALVESSRCGPFPPATPRNESIPAFKNELSLFVHLWVTRPLACLPLPPPIEGGVGTSATKSHNSVPSQTFSTNGGARFYGMGDEPLRWAVWCIGNRPVCPPDEEGEDVPDMVRPSPCQGTGRVNSGIQLDVVGL